MDFWQNMETGLRSMHWAEGAAVLSGIIYVILAAREQIACWFFGIMNGVFSVYLFWISELLAESVLYMYYILAGFYGWHIWLRPGKSKGADKRQVVEWHWTIHLPVVVAGLGLSWLLAWILREYTPAQMPILDAHTTVFSFLATYMVTRKVLSNWVYWIVIDAFSVWLYASRSLFLYAFLMAGYTLLAVWGFWQWKKQNSEVPINGWMK